MKVQAMQLLYKLHINSDLKYTSMLKAICLSLLMCFCLFASAQTLKKGNYTSSDGKYTVSVEQNGSLISIIEPNKKNTYKKANANYFYHADPKYGEFYVRVVSDSKFYSGKTNGGENLFTANNSESEETITSADNCPLYDKYLKLSKNDPEETQAWSFCAAAALAKCTYNPTASVAYVKAIIESLKSILVDQSKCPCEDVITKAEWNAVPNY